MRTDAVDRAPEPSDTLRDQWILDPEVIHLNHASYGACPRKVLEAQSSWRERIETQPGAFFTGILGEELARARAALGAFINADPDGLAYTQNVTVALNSVLGSIRFAEGDEILVTDHEYNATRNIAKHHALRGGAECVVTQIPFVGVDEDCIFESVMAGVSDRTRVAVLDHVTSQTGLIFPLERLIPELEARGVDVIVDGAHAPGMIDLDVESLAPAWYTGNCHKWLCAPKGAGFLWARADKREVTRPAIVSHGASVEDPGARFHAEFDWQGTSDPTAALCVPVALDVMNDLVPGGWDEVRATNHARIVAARQDLCDALDIEVPCPHSLLGSMATLPLPEAPGLAESTARSALEGDPLRALLLERFGIEVPVFRCDAHPGRLIRISAQLYNRSSDYEALVTALRACLGR